MTDPTAPGRLLELTVTDLALIDRLRLELGAGLNVITGETGAGKSLLIDALGLALGARADTTLVRHGADLARVEALFDRLEAAAPDKGRSNPHLGRAVGNLMAALRNRIAHEGWDEALVHEVTEILDDAARRIERLS